ncbi:T6SS immunity protein Tdi1 domain-containing protein [Nocardia sp. N2S4-5]|uniref:T6SS immunity protein Tdi1 domain-containing protein n=1 Tax=Nocardia sp. N2S4-5 TaxID=3351565 RepID=UPI0037D89BBE
MDPRSRAGNGYRPVAGRLPECVRADAALGPAHGDEFDHHALPRSGVAGFVPAPALGGALRADRVEIVDAEVHLRLLSDITPRLVMNDALRRPL